METLLPQSFALCPSCLFHGGYRHHGPDSVDPVDMPTTRLACPTCGQWSDHLLHSGTGTFNAKGEVLAVAVRCGWSGCGAEREIRRDQDWR